MNATINDLIEFVEDPELTQRLGFTIKHAVTGAQVMYGGIMVAGQFAVYRESDAREIGRYDATAASNVVRNGMRYATPDSIVKVLSKTYDVLVEAGLVERAPASEPAAGDTVTVAKPQQSARGRNLVRELSAVGDLQPSERQRDWARKHPADWRDRMAWAHNDASIELTQEEIDYAKALYQSRGGVPLLVNELYRW